MSRPFKFKYFEVQHDQCAMKVGTDGVLLGAWTSLENDPVSILDIGAGTGILSLMLAQRSRAELIDAIEIDADAYEQCVTNFEHSSWGDRLFCYHASLEEFVEEVENRYDLIVCNPPFYKDAYKSADSSRDRARFEDAMPFDHLLKSVTNLLLENGVFSTIIPFKEEDTFRSLAARFHLFPNKITHVKGHPFSEIKRSLIAFTFCPSNEQIKVSDVKINELVIETERHHYTDDYKNLTQDFYLKM